MKFIYNESFSCTMQLFVILSLLGDIRVQSHWDIKALDLFGLLLDVGVEAISVTKEVSYH